MIIAGVLKFTPEGRVLVTATPAGEVVFNGGTPVDSTGALVIDEVPNPIAYNGGLVYDAETTALGVLGSGGGGGPDPLNNQALIDELFAGNPLGFACELTVNAAFARGLLFQDVAGTIPAAVDSKVALLKDTSGVGIDAQQATSTRQAFLRIDGVGNHYLAFTGAEDYATGVLDFPTAGIADQVTIFASAEWDGGALRYMCKLGISTATTNLFALYYDGPTGQVKCDSGGGTVRTASGYNFDLKKVVVGICSIPLPSVVVRINGTPSAPNSSFQAPGTYASAAVGIGATSNGTSRFVGSMYTIPVIVGRVVEEILITRTEEVMAAALGFPAVNANSGGIVTGSDGLVPVTYTEPIAQYVAGLPLDATGQLCVTDVVPVVVSGFSSGFNEGF